MTLYEKRYQETTPVMKKATELPKTRKRNHQAGKLCKTTVDDM
jgi:hypothetical protein